MIPYPALAFITYRWKESTNKGSLL